ncbi:hypothetical protein PMI01_01194 [Caulobacter sp. AP07]|uniref:hypothetical protein n=1 Tax=Caulobacter sp. AP07 TaxID=1144304 RepID=UPI000271ED78|nr:hypothetical protein [Caulobacter sp. AP07]EJL35838.1 hypothetical protein PMI01_01194 [Caulobacter sp. AP07]
MIVNCHRLSALTACLLLAACKPVTETKRAETPPAASAVPAAAPAPVTFAHDPGLDSLGYYFTDAVVQAGNLKLISLNIGQASDFADWESGKRPATYAPIFMAFEDVTSPTAENELGQTYHTVSLRVMPTAYRVDGGEVSFHGVDPQVGEVTFSGAFDLDALKAAKAAGPGEPQAVLKGDLQVGDQHFRNVSFKYFGGE